MVNCKGYSSLDLYFEEFKDIRVMSKKEFLLYFNKYKIDLDKEAFDKIVMGNIALVLTVLKQNFKFDDFDYLDYLDYLQYGIIGLMKAIEQYDIETKYEFSTYAYPTILNNIKRARCSNRCIKLPEYMMSQYYSIQQVICDFEKKNCTIPTYDEIGEVLSMDPSEVERILSVFMTTTLQRCSNTTDEEDDIEYMIKNAIPNDANIVDSVLGKMTLENFIKDIFDSCNINEFDKRLIYYKIFNDETCSLSLTKIAKIIYKELGYGELNITKAEISRRYNKCIKLLRRLYVRHCSEEEKKILVK